MNGFVVTDSPSEPKLTASTVVCLCLVDFLLKARGINRDKADSISVNTGRSYQLCGFSGDDSGSGNYRRLQKDTEGCRRIPKAGLKIEYRPNVSGVVGNLELGPGGTLGGPGAEPPAGSRAGRGSGV